MRSRVPQTRTAVIVLAVAAVLVVWQSVGWLWGAGKFEEDLHQARLGYEHTAPHAYRVEFSMGPCLCFGTHVRVTVVDGTIVKVVKMKPPQWDDPFPAGVLSTSRHLEQQDELVEKYVVFPHAFDVIAAMADADVVQLDIDGAHGIPSRVYVDWRKGTFDDELTYHWRNFEVLDR